MASGNGANGATHESPLPAVIATIAASDNGHGALSSPAQLQNIRELLCEPFDPSDIKWRVTATSTHQGKHGPQKSIDVLNGVPQVLGRGSEGSGTSYNGFKVRMIIVLSQA